MAGQGMPLDAVDRYPDATRFAETRKSLDTPPNAFGSGPRGRRFKSSRPDQFPKKSRETKPAGALGFPFGSTSRNRALAASNPDFIQKSFEISRLRRSRLVDAARLPRQSATLDATRHVVGY